MYRIEVLPETWAKALGEAYARSLVMQPVEPRASVVNRDRL